MKNARNKDVNDRAEASIKAKAALLEAYKAAKVAAEPGRETKLAERLSLVEAREQRKNEREQTKREELLRIATELAEAEALAAATEKAENEARELANKERMASIIGDEAARKMERDRRYANRKARQG